MAAVMNDAARSVATESHVVANLGYIEPQPERPYDFAYEPPGGMPWQNYRSDSRPVRISDARSLAAAPALHREGFMLVNAASLVRDFFDEAAVKSIYYAEVAELARAALGGSRAYVFDHLVRQREAGSALTFGRRVAGERPSANGRVHNDYTEGSGPRRMQQVLSDQTHPHPDLPPEAPSGSLRAENASEENQGFPPRPPFLFSRYAIVNVWRPIKGPVLDAPLALCDARSVAAADRVVSDVHYRDRSGEIYLLTHAPAHRWFYFSGMQPNEALMFKQFDSDTSVPRFVPHAAFDHPDTPRHAPLRKSIEARVLVVFD